MAGALLTPRADGRVTSRSPVRLPIMAPRLQGEAHAEGLLDLALWGAGSLGVAVRTLGNNWIYAAPRLGNIGFDWAFGIPAGVSVDLTHGFVLRAEAQLSWADFVYYNRRLHLASGLAYQW